MKEEILKALKTDNRLPNYMRYGIIEGGNGNKKRYIKSPSYQTHLYSSKSLYKPILLMKL